MDYYLLLKSLHIIAVIAWMAGMLYLPRLFVYHADVPPESESSQLLKIMEKRLLRYIINPAMIAVFVLGILLMIETGAGMSGGQGWMHAKIFLVLVLAGIHGLLARHRKQFLNDKNTKSSKYYRILNEVPTLIMIFVVLLVVMKPF